MKQNTVYTVYTDIYSDTATERITEHTPPIESETIHSCY